jgi:hypothetical protein
MGKKDKKDTKKKVQLDDDASDASEDTAELAGGGAAEEPEELEVEQDRGEVDRGRISAAVEGLTEKRATTREGSLRSLTGILQMAHASHEESLSGFSESFDTAVIGSLGRGGLEGVYAANLLSVVFVVLGQSAYGSEIWNAASRKLKLIGNKRDLEDSKACAASATALLAHSIGLICCGGENNIEEIESAMDLYVELAAGHMSTADGSVSGHVSTEVRTVAFQNWGFLAGSLPLSSRAVRCSAMLPHVASILAIEGGEYDVDLRNEAGQLAALMSEIVAGAKQEAQVL